MTNFVSHVNFHSPVVLSLSFNFESSSNQLMSDSDSDSPPPLENASSELQIAPNQQKPREFGGLKGGFFNKPASSATPTAVDKLNSDIKQAVNEQAPAPWLTPSLLDQVMSNPALERGFQNPRVMAAIQELGKDPQAALLKYQGDAEIDKFLKFALWLVS